MSCRRLFNLALIPLLIIGLLASSASASSYVWCVSADGDHAVVEFAPTGDCSRDDCAPATAGVAPPGVTTDAAGCGPCLDISSAHQWNVSRGRPGEVPADSPAALPLAVPDVVNPVPARVLNSCRLVDPPPRIPAAIRLHRTTVLLI